MRIPGHEFRCSDELGTLPSVYTASVQPEAPDARTTDAAMRPARRALPLIAFLAFAFAPCTAFAAAPNVPDDQIPLASAVQMTTLSPCFDRVALTNAIERWLERSTVDARLRVLVYIDAGVPSFSIRLGDDPPLVRRFDESPEDCESERDALALSIALAIDAIAPAIQKAGEPVWALNLSALATTPWTERVNFGGAIALGLRIGKHFEPQLGASFSLAGDQSISGVSMARLDTRLILARASGCFTTPVFDTASVLACGGMTLGPSTLSASGLTGAASETHAFWAAAGTLEIRFRIAGDLGLHLAADVLASLRRGTMRIDGADGQAVYVETLPAVIGLFRVGPTAFF
jgi:hypothetical protein